MCNMIVDGIAYTFGIFMAEFVTHFEEGPSKVAWVGSLLSGMYLTAGNLSKCYFIIMLINWFVLKNRTRCISTC